MFCFEDYIGVGLHCQTSDSVSGKYITDLPGVSLQNIDSVANEGQGSFIGVFADVKKRAISRLNKDVLSFLKSQYNLKKSVQTYSTGGELSGQESSLNKKHGVNVFTYYTGSELLRFYVGNVYLYALEEQETTIEIYSETNLVWSRSITTEVGWNTIVVNAQFDSVNLTISYDDSNFTDIPNLVLLNNLCGCVDFCDDCEIQKEGVSFTNPASLTRVNDTHGLIVEVSVRCSYDAIICANIDLYSDAYLYALGVELMRERMYSDRVNRFTTVDRKRAGELLELFTQDYQEFLKTANDTVNINDDSCIECLEMSGYKYQLP